MTTSKQRFLIAGLIIIGVVFVGFFGLRFLRVFKEFRGHRPPPFEPASADAPETDVELIREWMTIGFISHTYRTPPNLLYKALGISPKDNEEKSLEQLNEEYFPDTPGYVIATVKAAILANQAAPNKAPTAPVPETAKPPEMTAPSPIPVP